MQKKDPVTLLLLLVFFFANIGNVIAQQPQTGQIIVKVIAFRSGSGHIQLSLYDKASDFPKIDVRTAMKRQALTNSSVAEVVFDNVPFGTYAIAGLHDENSNGEMDFNFIGLPQEGYCFSNDAHPVFSPPSFKKAKFDLHQKKKVLYVAMQY